MGGKRLLMLTILVDEPRRCSDERTGDEQNEENDEPAMPARRSCLFRYLRLSILRILRLGREGSIAIRTDVRGKDGVLAYLEGDIEGILLRQHDGLVRREVEVSCFAGKIERLREICVPPRHVRYLTTRTGRSTPRKTAELTEPRAARMTPRPRLPMAIQSMPCSFA